MNKSTTTDGTEQPPTETALERLPQKGMRIEEAAFPFSSSSVGWLSPRNNNVITLIHAFIYLTPLPSVPGSFYGATNNKSVF